jgi:hypothetical protein
VVLTSSGEDARTKRCILRLKSKKAQTTTTQRRCAGFLSKHFRRTAH